MLIIVPQFREQTEGAFFIHFFFWSRARAGAGRRHRTLGFESLPALGLYCCCGSGYGGKEQEIERQREVEECRGRRDTTTTVCAWKRPRVVRMSAVTSFIDVTQAARVAP